MNLFGMASFSIRSMSYFFIHNDDDDLITWNFFSNKIHIIILMMDMQMKRYNNKR